MYIGEDITMAIEEAKKNIDYLVEDFIDDLFIDFNESVMDREFPMLHDEEKYICQCLLREKYFKEAYDVNKDSIEAYVKSRFGSGLGITTEELCFQFIPVYSYKEVIKVVEMIQGYVNDKE